MLNGSKSNLVYEQQAVLAPINRHWASTCVQTTIIETSDLKKSSFCCSTTSSSSSLLVTIFAVFFPPSRCFYVFFLPIHQCFCRLDTSLIMNLMFEKVHLKVLILTIFPVKMVLCFCLVCKQFELLFPSTFPSCRSFSHLDSMDVRHLSVCLIIIWQLFGQANSTHVHSSNSFRRIFLHIFFSLSIKRL